MRSAAWFILFAGAAMPLFAAPRPPNVLLIISDDQGYGDLSIHGNPHVQTPNLDSLAKQSVRLDQFHVNPLCAPTRAALLTGRYSIRSGVSGVARGEETMRADEVTLGELFHSNGYKTGYFGKWHNGEHYPYTPPGQGFAESLSFNLGHWNNYFDTSLKRNGAWTKTRGFISDVLTDEAMAFVEKHKEKPWFCYLAYNVPHSPLQCPDAFFDKYKTKGLGDELACIYGMCENMDHNIGRLLKKLDELFLSNDTIVVFLTDNGPNGDRFNGAMRGRKGQYYLGGVRVPCLIRWRRRLDPKVVSSIAAHIDLFPTLAELTDARIPSGIHLDGKSLAPLLRGEARHWPDRTLFIQNRPAGAGGNNSGCVRTQRHHLVITPKGAELFDLNADPGESKNIARENSSVAKQLRQDYDAWLIDVSKGARKQRLPIPVGHANEPIVELPVPQAELEGGVKFNGRHPNNGWAVGFTNKDARVVWQIEVVEAGEFEVVLHYLCAREGSLAQVRLGTTTLQTPIRAVERKQAPSPDRAPRTEVYEMEWARLPLGKLSLSKGPATVAVAIAGANDTFELKHVSLTRSK